MWAFATLIVAFSTLYADLSSFRSHAIDVGIEHAGEQHDLPEKKHHKLPESNHVSHRGHLIPKIFRKAHRLFPPLEGLTPARNRPRQQHGRLMKRFDRMNHLFGHDDSPRIISTKNYDTQGQPTVCVHRNESGDNKCHLEPCGAGGDDYYGFVMHEQNTRGAAMKIGGMARMGSGCAVSHRYKFVYIHVLKSAGMTVKAFLKKALCGEAFPAEQSCPMGGNKQLEIMDCVPAVFHHPDYFVFSFVRNPFARMFSAYSMADGMRTEQQKDTPMVPFDRFVQMGYAERRRVSIVSPSHYSPQVNFLFDENSCPVFDYLGRLEQFDHDMQIIINQIQSPELQTYFDSTSGQARREKSTSFGERKKEAELDGKLSNAYRSGETVETVASIYNVDFELLRYDKANTTF
jgi:hypothetical protein